MKKYSLIHLLGMFFALTIHAQQAPILRSTSAMPGSSANTSSEGFVVGKILLMERGFIEFGGDWAKFSFFGLTDSSDGLSRTIFGYVRTRGNKVKFREIGQFRRKIEDDKFMGKVFGKDASMSVYAEENFSGRRHFYFPNRPIGERYESLEVVNIPGSEVYRRKPVFLNPNNMRVPRGPGYRISQREFDAWLEELPVIPGRHDSCEGLLTF